MGTGTVWFGLASVIIGTSLFKKVTLLRATTSVVIGSILYKACVARAPGYAVPFDLKLSRRRIVRHSRRGHGQKER